MNIKRINEKEFERWYAVLIPESLDLGKPHAYYRRDDDDVIGLVYEDGDWTALGLSLSVDGYYRPEWIEIKSDEVPVTQELYGWMGEWTYYGDTDG